MSREKAAGYNAVGGEVAEDDSVYTSSALSFDDMVNNGEMIMLTVSGPETYYDYHGRGMGLQYLLCEKFAQKIGVSLRVEMCKDEKELLTRLKSGEGDVIAYQLPKNAVNGILYCGAHNDERNTQWAVQKDNEELAVALNEWFKPSLLAQCAKEESFLLSSRSMVRHVYSPMQNKNKGIISSYDVFFRKYAALCRWDWRLLAALCYQESAFDPQARSWVGACGLMQIMPTTADHIGLPRSEMFEPEANIAAACRYIAELKEHFRDVTNPAEQNLFVLAGYNGGYFHIRDAMALARAHGRNPYHWADVREYVLKLSAPTYYNHPVVKHGYMRGMETANYVDNIRNRWAQYQNVAVGAAFVGSGVSGIAPQKARKHNRYGV